MTHCDQPNGDSEDTHAEASTGSAHEARMPPRHVVPTEARLRSVVGNAPAVLFALDPDGTVALYEGKGLRALGFLPPEDLVGHSIFEVAAHMPHVLSDARRALGGEALTSTMPLGSHTFDVRWEPLVSDSGAITSVTGVALDITERAAESRRQAAIAELRHWALQGASVQELMNAAVRAVPRALNAPFVRVVDVLPGRDGVRLVAAFGWPLEALGTVERFPPDDAFLRDPASRTGTLMVSDWRAETRYQLRPELQALGIISSLTVPMLAQSERDAHRFISVFTTEPRVFMPVETAFLYSVTRVVTDAATRVAGAESERAALYGDMLRRLENLQELVSRLLSSQERTRREIAVQVHGKQLTDREQQILRLVAEGWSNREIGAELALAAGTVKNHVARILSKLDVTDRTQAAVRALDLGLIQSRP